MNAVRWVLIDHTKGATTQDGAKLSPAVLAHIAEAVQAQVNQEFAAEWGAQATLRVGTNLNDIEPGEWAYAFLRSLPDAPDASATHDSKTGVAIRTITRLQDLDSQCCAARIAHLRRIPMQIASPRRCTLAG